jgi:hypothetical protein
LFGVKNSKEGVCSLFKYLHAHILSENFQATEYHLLTSSNSNLFEK